MQTGKTGGSWSLGGLLQFWGLYSDRQHQTYPAANRAQALLFRIRRADFRLKGEIIPKKVSFATSIDPSKSFNAQATVVSTPTGTTNALTSLDNDRSVIQDFYLTLQSDYVDFVVGQFKTPISSEANWSSGKLLFPERGLVSSVSGLANGGVSFIARDETAARNFRGYGDNREVGFKLEKKIADVFYYSIGLYNGPSVDGSGRLVSRQGQLTDDDLAKDLGIRLEAYPIKGLNIGAAFYNTVGRTPRTAMKDIVNFDLHYENYGFFAHHEYIHAWTKPPRYARKAIEGHGYSGAFGYTIANQFQPAVRVGFLNPNIDLKRNTLMVYEVGFNYLLQGHDYKVQFAYSTFDPLARGIKPTRQGVIAVQGSF